MSKITVIVPVYNVENYLSSCIESILAQTYGDFELVLVNDGSTDRCGEICDYYALKDSRINVIHQENRGLSGARNSGLDIAQGKYIIFIDSDDIVNKDYFERMIALVQREVADIYVCGVVEFEEEDDFFNDMADDNTSSLYNYKIYDGKKACIALYEGNADVPINACGKMYCEHIIKNRRFPVGKIHEDQALVPLLCYESDKIVVTEMKLYGYRIRAGSITKEKFSVKRYDDIWAINSCINFFENKEEYDIVIAAKNKRQRLLCTYSIYAKRDGVKIPQEYKVNIWKALKYLRKNVSEDKFKYYLGQVNMKYVYGYEYIKKMKSILHEINM